ncbi:MAG: hypothetical protein HRU20_09910 [Pseudomonadales bacterium]|nr:hypothetical protein [Pseudomonadales bacterium]
MSATIKHNMKSLLICPLLVGILVITGCSSTQEREEEKAWLKAHPLYEGNDAALFVDEEFKKDEDDDKKQFIIKADASLANGDFDVALFGYLRALRLDENDKTIYFKIGLVHEKRRNFSLAEVAYRKAISLDGEYISAIERTGKILLKRRKYISAQKMFKQSIDLDQLRLKDRMAEQERLKEMELAARDAAKGDIAKLSKEEEAYNAISAQEKEAIMKPVFYIKTEAVRSYVLKEYALTYYDKSSPLYAYNGMAVIADMDKKHKKAQQYYKLAKVINPRSAMVFNNVGYSFYLVNDLKKAEENFNKAIYLDNDYAEPWRNLSLIYVRKGHYKKAVNLLISKFDDEASAYNTVGYICMLEGKHELAENNFTKAIDLSPVYYKAANENRDRNRELYSRTIYETLTHY